MKNRYTKKVQRAINRKIRNIKRNLKKDVFGDRYDIRQIGNYFLPYLDGTGEGDYYITIELFDNVTKKTKVIKNINIIYPYLHWLAHEILIPMNDFIVIDTDFWGRHPDGD